MIVKLKIQLPRFIFPCQILISNAPSLKLISHQNTTFLLRFFEKYIRT